MDLAAKGPESGLLRTALGRPVSFDSAALCPDDTLLYMTASVDTGDVLGACGRLLAALPPEVGHELDLTMLWKLNVHSAMLVGYSHFWDSDFIQQTGSSENANLVYVQYAYKF